MGKSNSGELNLSFHKIVNSHHSYPYPLLDLCFECAFRRDTLQNFKTTSSPYVIETGYRRVVMHGLSKMLRTWVSIGS